MKQFKGPFAFPDDLVAMLATNEDGVARAVEIAEARFQEVAAPHYAAAALGDLQSHSNAVSQRLEEDRALIEKLERSGDDAEIDPDTIKHVPWKFSSRLSWLLLKAVGLVSIAAVVNSLAAFVISSGAVDAFVLQPALAVLFVFVAGAIVAALDAGYVTLRPKFQSVAFIFTAAAAVVSFIWWLYEVGHLVNSAGISHTEVIAGALSGALSKELLWSQVAAESGAGLLCWIVAARLADAHTLKGIVPTATYLKHQERARLLTKELTSLNQELDRKKGALAQLDAARHTFVVEQSERVRAAINAASTVTREREQRQLAKELLINDFLKSKDQKQAAHNGHRTLPIQTNEFPVNSPIILPR